MNAFDRAAKYYNFFMRFTNLYRPEEVIKKLNPKKSESILDLGGGTGVIANDIAKSGAKVTVLDLSCNMLKQALKSNYDILLCRGDASTMPFSSEVFDAIVCTDAIHHFEMQEESLKEIYRILKKGGKVVVEEFDSSKIQVKLLRLFESIIGLKPKYIIPTELKKMFLKLGLPIKTHKISDFEYLLVGEKK